MNGKKADWSLVDAASGSPELLVVAPETENAEITIRWKGKPLQTLVAGELNIDAGGQISLRAPQGIQLCEIYDPQGISASTTIEGNSYSTNINKGVEGHHTFFVRPRHGDMDWWQPVNVFIQSPYVPHD